MNVTKTKRKHIIAVILAFIGFCAFALSLNGEKFASAEIAEQTVYSDSFNAKSLSDSWSATDADVLSEYSSLRVLPDHYGWGAHIICSGYKLTGSCRLELELEQLPGGDERWFALSFGVSSVSNIFEKHSGAFIFANGVTQVFKKGADAGKTFSFSPLDVSSPERKTIIVDFEKTSDVEDIYKITFTLKKNGSQINSTTLTDFEVEDGYFGFNSYNVNFDVLQFNVYEGDTPVYKDDFSQSKIAYANTADKTANWHANSEWVETAVGIAPVGSLNLKQIGSSAIYKQPFEKAYDNVSVLYKMSAKFDFSKASLKVATGFEIGKNSLAGSGTFVGIKREYTGYYLVVYDGQELEQRKININAVNGEITVTLSAYYDNTVKVTIGSITESISVDTVEGYYGFKTSDCCGKTGDGACADDFEFICKIYKEKNVTDKGINFEGTRKYEDEDGEYYRYYYSAKEWYAGSKVRLGNYDVADSGYVLFSNAQPNSSFGPKTRYGDCIVRFNITFVGNGYYYDNPTEYNGECDNEFFGLWFGADGYSNIVENTQALGISTVNGKSMYNKMNCTLEINTEDTTVRSASDSTKEYDLFRKNATYNFMYVIKNGTVTMHFKEAGEDESVLEVVRERVSGVKTEGYLAVFGTLGIDFKLDDFSVTSLDRSYTSSEYLGADNLETLRLDTAKGDSLSKAFASNDNTLTTTGVVGSNIARITLGDVNAFTYKHGDLNIVFSENGAQITDGNVTKTVEFSKKLTLSGATIEITRIGGTVTIAFVNADAPLAALDDETYEVSGFKSPAREKLSIELNSADGLEKVAIFNLDSNVTLSARDFNAETDITEPWPVRESLQSNSKGCSGSINGLNAVLGGTLLVAMAFLLKKEKKHV